MKMEVFHHEERRPVVSRPVVIQVSILLPKHFSAYLMHSFDGGYMSGVQKFQIWYMGFGNHEIVMRCLGSTITKADKLVVRVK